MTTHPIIEAMEQVLDAGLEAAGVSETVDVEALARAAYTAYMGIAREPSEGMVHDSNASDPNTMQGGTLPFLDAATLAYIWQAMHDQQRREVMGDG